MKIYMNGSDTTHWIDPSTDARWDTFVENHPDGTIYHHSSWKEVIEQSFGYSPLYRVLEDNTGRIRSAFPVFLTRGLLSGKRLVSLPFSDYCNVLVESEDDLGLILQEIVESPPARSSGQLRICLRDCIFDMRRHGFTTGSIFKNHLLHIDRPIDDIWDRVIDGSRRRNVNTAVRAGLSIFCTDGDPGGSMEEFYTMHVLTRRKHGLPPLPRRFFENVGRILGPRGMASLLLARAEHRAVSGMILLRFKDTLYCLSNASLENRLDMRPNDLLWWEGIRIAEKEGLRSFDFGRTSPANEGLLSFKRKWGTVEKDIVHWVLPLRGRIKEEGKGVGNSRLLQGIVRRVPSKLLRVGGQLLYKHLV